jgi:hypothetical protein
MYPISIKDVASLGIFATKGFPDKLCWMCESTSKLKMIT